MKNWKWKKILSIVLAALLVVALLPNTVNASDTDVSDGTTQIRTITLDDDGNIISSSDGTITDDQTGSQDDQTAAIADTDQSDTNTQTDQTDNEQTNQADTNQTDTGAQTDESNVDTDQTGSDTSTGSTEESNSSDSGAGEDDDSSETGTEASTDDAQSGTGDANSETTNNMDAGANEGNSGSGEVTSSDNTQDGTDESNSDTANNANAGGEASGSTSENDPSADGTQDDVNSSSESEGSGSEGESADSNGENADGTSQSGSITTETFTVENNPAEASAVNSISETVADETEEEASEETLSDEVTAYLEAVEALSDIKISTDNYQEVLAQLEDCDELYASLTEEDLALDEVTEAADYVETLRAECAVISQAAVEAVNALLAELPTVDELKGMSGEDRSAAYEKTQNTYDAYDALSDDEKEVADADGVALLFAVLEYFDSLTNASSNVDKTLTVDGSATEVEGETYTTIQDAINYINSLADDNGDEDGWTITVNAGSYARFTVLNGIDNLTVQAAEGVTVTISTMDGSDNPDTVSGANPETDGVSIRNAQNVTLDGLTFTMGTTKRNWVAAAVSNYTEQTEKGDNFTVKNCTFQGSGTGYAVFINTGTTKFTVTGCSFDNVYDGVEMYGDNTVMAGASVTYNTFTNCAFAMHGYYGGTGDAGTLTFAYNTVTGTSDLRCKVVVQDQNNTRALKVDVHDNTFEYALVGLVNLQEDGETVSDVLSSNTFEDGSFYVKAVEPGSVTVTYASYQAPSDDTGYWVLTGIENNSLISYNASVDADILEAIQTAIDEANANGSKTLNITSVDIDEDGQVDENELIRTFTWCKDAIYWVSTEKTYSLRIYKFDKSTFNKTISDSALNNSEPLANAVFYLCDEDGTRISGALITDESGFAVTDGLLSGTYKLVEYAAPTGYLATETSIEIIISEDTVDDNGVYTVEVANAAIPQTGGMGSQPFTVAGIAILLLASLAYVVTRRRVY